MKPVATSKEAIMKVCREIVMEKGLEAISMRTVAQRCGIATGTLYNYYADKDALLLAAVESVWQSIFHAEGACSAAAGFVPRVESLFTQAKEGAERVPQFLTAHAVAIAKSRRGEGRSTMERCFAHMKAGLLDVLQRDPQVDPTVFTDALTQAKLVDFVLDNLLMLLAQGAEDCDVLCALLRRVLYRQK